MKLRIYSSYAFIVHQWGWGVSGGYTRGCARDLTVGKLALLVSLIPPEFVDHTPGEILVALDGSE